MARKKVILAYIASDATRRATLKKRRRGLLKKVNELSILCGVSACAVVYSPQFDQPEVFPSTEEAKRILTELADLPEIDRNKKMVNQRTFLEQRLVKLNQQVRRLEHENKELGTAVWLHRCLTGNSVDSLGKEEAEDLLDLVDRKTKALQVRMHQLGPLMLPAIVEDMNVKEMISYDAAAVEAMRRCEFITGCGLGGDMVGVGGAEGSGGRGGRGGDGNFGGGCGGGDDELMAFFEQMNSNSSSSNRSAWEGFLPAPYY